MRAVPVVKMSGTGNDFLLVDNRRALLREEEKAAFARAACPRRVSAGADGVLLLEAAANPGHHYRMRIFNADGSEAEMCGNGSRCLAVFAWRAGAAGLEQTIQTLAGTLQALVAPDGNSARVRLSPPGQMEERPGAEVLGRKFDLFCLNTGVPHAAVFVDDVAGVDVARLGAAIRNHPLFQPRGANANFVQVLDRQTLALRTYERGVEGETLACGTGATASAILAALVRGCLPPITVRVASGEELKIHFEPRGRSSTPPHLEGPVRTVYAGEFYWNERS